MCRKLLIDSHLYVSSFSDNVLDGTLLSTLSVELILELSILCLPALLTFLGLPQLDLR